MSSPSSPQSHQQQSPHPLSMAFRVPQSCPVSPRRSRPITPAPRAVLSAFWHSPQPVPQFPSPGTRLDSEGVVSDLNRPWMRGTQPGEAGPPSVSLSRDPRRDGPSRPLVLGPGCGLWEPRDRALPGTLSGVPSFMPSRPWLKAPLQNMVAGALLFQER